MARKQSRCVSSLSWSKRVNETKIGNRNRMRTSRGAAHPDVLHSTDAAETKSRINDAAAPADDDDEIQRILQLKKIVSLNEFISCLRRRITSLLATGTKLLTKQWKFCAVAANATPEPHRTDLLNMCHESAIRYVLSCRECVVLSEVVQHNRHINGLLAHGHHHSGVENAVHDNCQCSL
ncbi:Hypothetical protein, putative [Bodo saltans]|uniref:Uncharacterized protein n=1 Tax=Bodo saltans TaxID=75058 RepID=A0A0S4JJ57_BODSA|nr:Hypothetical protein, putative [Bodo saltans]|eukprot:CUG90109.1 Hypothetical protein, putative [Bodo saltans]